MVNYGQFNEREKIIINQLHLIIFLHVILHLICNSNLQYYVFKFLQSKNCMTDVISITVKYQN